MQKSSDTLLLTPRPWNPIRASEEKAIRSLRIDIVTEKKGICLRRDNWVSVRYAEELNSGKSSVLLQRADRHGILGQKPADLQRHS